MGDKYPKLKVAAVQAAPVFLDREATTKKACELIKEAGKNKAKIIVFPEGFIPTHPVWFLFHSTTSKIANQLSVELFKNSLEIPSVELDELCKATKAANAYVIMGACEKLPKTTGTMFNIQVYISPDGEYLGKHQKFMPTTSERIVHKGGDGDTFGTIDTKYGPISAMVCGENFNPLAVFSLTAEGTMIHGMSWPNFWRLTGKPMREYVKIGSQSFAQVSKAFVISSCSTVSDEMIEKMQLSDKESELLKKPDVCGGSMIVAPDTEIIAGPMGSEEGILYGEIDLESCVKGKLRHDFSGHYNRADIFQLYVNKSSAKLYNKVEQPNIVNKADCFKPVCK